MGYQAFLIAPYKTGLDTDLDPWMTPADGFTGMTNAHIHHGVTEKRSGSHIFGEMVHTSANNNITAAVPANPQVITLVNNSLTNGTRIQINYVDGMTELNGLQFLVSATAMGAGGTITLQNLEGVNINGSAFTAGTTTGQVSTFPGDRLMGLHRYVDSTNVKNLLAFDTTRAAIFSKTNDSFQPLDNNGVAFTDIFTSENTDYVWAANWGSITSTAATPLVRLYFTNGKQFVTGPPDTDGIWQYNSGAVQSVTTFRPQVNVAQGGPFIDGCQLIFAFQQRLVLLNTIEGGQIYAQRARWSQAQNPDGATAWDDATPGRGGFVDAPTGDHIISARFLQNILIVFFTDSIWSLSPTADPALAFRWDKINNFRSSAAKMATYEYDRYVGSLGQRGITATTGVETQRIDERIEDFVKDEVDAEHFDKVFALRSYAQRRNWILYPPVVDDEDDDGNPEESIKALIFDDESSAYSKYEFDREVGGDQVDFNVLGYGEIEDDFTLADFPLSPESNPKELPVYLDQASKQTLQSYIYQGDSDIFLGGTRNGEVLVLETQDGSDSGASIKFEINSAAWNPFKEDGVECQMGYVDFYVNTDRLTKATVEFFKNNESNPYLTTEIDFLPNLDEIAEISNAVVNTDPTTGFTISASKNGLSTGDIVYIYGIEGSEFINGGPYTITVVDDDTFTVAEDMTGFGSEIIAPGITQANPGVVSVTVNKFLDDTDIYFLDISGMIELNFTGSNFFKTANGTDVMFEIDSIDTTGFTAWTSGGYVFEKYINGGVVVEKPFTETKAWKRAFAGGVGYWHKMTVKSEGKDRPIRILAYMPWFRKRGRRMVN